MVETRRYRTYHECRRRWVEEYREQGYIDIATGFRCWGPMTRNQVMNYHIQGPAFHGLLWSLTRIVGTLRRGRWRSRVVGQIHDSIIADVHRDELDDYLAMVKRVTTQDLVEEWPWIDIPLIVEAEVAETSWHEKREVEL